MRRVIQHLCVCQMKSQAAGVLLSIGSVVLKLGGFEDLQLKGLMAAVKTWSEIKLNWHDLLRETPKMKVCFRADLSFTLFH